jgi:hypothetical protein
MTISSALSRKGIRQLHDKNFSLGSCDTTNGRAKKPIPKVANDSSTPDAGYALGKNNFGKTSAVAVP